MVGEKKKNTKKKIESITQEGPLKKMRKQSDDPVNMPMGIILERLGKFEAGLHLVFLLLILEWQTYYEK